MTCATAFASTVKPLRVAYLYWEEDTGGQGQGEVGG